MNPGRHFSASKRVLEPNERIAEVLFGLIMVLTCTGSLSVAESGSGSIRRMFVSDLSRELAQALKETRPALRPATVTPKSAEAMRHNRETDS